MKKIIVKISTGIFLLGILLVNITIQDSKLNDGELLIANIGAFATAQVIIETEGGIGLPTDCEPTWEAVNCKSGGVWYSFAKNI